MTISEATLHATRGHRIRPRQGGDLLTIIETAGYLRISKYSVYRLMKSGEIPYLMVGAARRVRMEDIEAYLERSA